MSGKQGAELPVLDPDAVASLIRGRRTAERFKPELPPKRVIEAAVEVARWAPNHKLTQPWRFYHLGPASIASVLALNYELVSTNKGEAAADAKHRRWSAVPGWLAVTRVRDHDELRAREDYGACCCAVQNLMLHLWSHGVASKWSTGAATRDPRFYDCLGADSDHEEVVALVWYGYPDHEPKKQRMPVADILFDRP